MQEALRRDLPALHAAFSAFNSWLDEDWGFDRGDGRLYAAPMITLADPQLAEAEVSRVLDAGARVLVTVPGPVPDGAEGYVSPAHPKFDRVWGLIAEAGVPMVLHAGLSGVSHYGKFWRTSEPGQGGGGGFEGFKHASFPLVAFAAALIAFRGCPLCWLMGMSQLIAAKAQGKPTDGLCLDGSCALPKKG
jgi:hypothetical protein